MLARQRIILLNKIISSKVLQIVQPFNCIHDDSTNSISQIKPPSALEIKSDNNCKIETISNSIENDTNKLKVSEIN